MRRAAILCFSQAEPLQVREKLGLPPGREHGAPLPVRTSDGGGFDGDESVHGSPVACDQEARGIGRVGQSQKLGLELRNSAFEFFSDLARWRRRLDFWIKIKASEPLENISFEEN